MNDNIQQFASNLKMIRKGKKLTQTQLADKLGITKQSIINYEKGVTFPTGNRLNDLLKVLEITPDRLLSKDFLQTQEEKEMIEACHEKAMLMAGQTLDEEQGFDYDIVRERLYQQVEKLSNDEIYQALLGFYDQKIQKAKSRYVGELHNHYIRPTISLKSDIVVEQEDDK